MEYTREDYEKDLVDPKMPHLKDKARFLAFYEMLGSDEPALSVQYPCHRMNWVKPKKGGLILVLGCHAGYDLVKWLLSDKKAFAIGVDISKSILEEAQRRLDKAGVSKNALLVKSFIEDLPKYPPTFKREDEKAGRLNMEHITDIVLTETLEHVQEPVSVLSVAKWFMSEGSTLWISVPNHRWGNFSHARGINSEELLVMLYKVGFSKQNVKFVKEKGSMTYAKIVL